MYASTIERLWFGAPLEKYAALSGHSGVRHLLWCCADRILSGHSRDPSPHLASVLPKDLKVLLPLQPLLNYNPTCVPGDERTGPSPKPTIE